jgi:hypothetical protein
VLEEGVPSSQVYEQTAKAKRTGIEQLVIVTLADRERKALIPNKWR